MKATKLELRRTRFKMTQAQLSGKSGIGQHKISLMETGLVPTKHEAKKIAKALKTTSANLFKEVR